MRKIKLMALLLATLMIVSAFAGCAGVKKEELDALDVRVQALEDLLNGQQKDLAEIKDSVNAGKDNSDVLEAIESIKKDLEDKIKDVDGRVDEVGKADGATTVSDETKAAQQKALALIEVRRAEFNKVADEYAAADYTKISEALGTATGAVNAATTTTAVDAAMAALNAELGKYMTYAMKAYDYYTQLLGGVNADAADLVAEARAFLKEVKAVYDEKVDFVGTIETTQYANTNPAAQLNGWEVELLYLVEDKDNDARDVYINIYAAITALCNLYDSTSATWVASNIYVENAKGKLDTVEVYTLKAFEKKAKDLVVDIDEMAGDEITFKYVTGTTTPDFGTLEALYNEYSAFAEAALVVGGEKLAALITNADKIEAVQATIKNLKDANDAFNKATKIGIGQTADVFFYYDVLVALSAQNDEKKLEVNIAKNAYTLPGTTIQYPSKAQNEVWVADEYAKVEDLLDEWKTSYNLSEKQALDIIKANKGTNYYTAPAKTTATASYATTTYVYNKLVSDLTVAAYNTFKSDVAPKIIAANAMSESVQLVLAIDDVKDSIEDLLKLQKMDRDADYPANININMTDVDNLKIMVRDADIFGDYVDDADARLTAAFTNKLTTPASAATLTTLNTASYIDFYSFEADINELENNGGTYFGYVGTGTTPTDNRANGSVYKFFVNEYTALKTAADSINAQIETLVEKVESNGLANNLEFVTLAGDYVALNANKIVDTDSDGIADAVAPVYIPFDVNANGTIDQTDYDGDGVNDGPERKDISAETYTDANGNTYAQDGTNDDKYVSVNKLYPKQDMIKAYVDTAIANNNWTIFVFLYENPEFEELLDLDEFNAAKKTMDERMVELFAKAEQFVDEVDAIEYVRIDTTPASATYTPYTTVIYKDVDKDGKYSTGDTILPAISNTGAYKYVVSLEDSADVNAAFATYSDWAKKGGALDQQMFANYVNNQVEVADVYYMKGLGALKIAVANSTETVHKLREDIRTLKTDADNFIATVNNVKAVHAENAFVVNFSSQTNNLAGDTSKRSHFAWTSFAKHTHENADTENGVYGVVKAGGVNTGSLNLNYNSTYNNNTAVISGLANGKGIAADACITKKALLQAAQGYYEAFKDAHVEYIADADNDYSEGNTVYYQRTEYVPYADFDAKVAEYEAYDVLSVKGYIYGLTSNSTDKYIKEFNSLINASKSLSEIENIIVNYESNVAVTLGITSANLDAYAVYEFDRLVDLGM